jgi:hypothetical protein
MCIHTYIYKYIRFSSIACVGVECLLEPRTLLAIGGVGLDASDLLTAHKLFQSSGFNAKEMYRVAACLFCALELDSSVLHDLISAVDIHMHVVPTDRRKDSRDDPIEDGGDNLRAHTGGSSSKNHSLAMSLTLPLAIACTSNQGDSKLNKHLGERVQVSSTFSSTGTKMSAAETCYRLLIGNLDEVAANESNDTDNNHSASRAMAGVLSATYLSQLMEYCDTDFFKSLNNKKG